MNWNLHIPKGDWDTLKYVVAADFHRMMALIDGIDKEAYLPLIGVTWP
jgi:hypothetical protein